jgi:hypothetical protein
MKVMTDMKDDKHPFEKIKHLSTVIQSLCQPSPLNYLLRLSPIHLHQKHRLFPIPEDQEYTEEFIEIVDKSVFDSMQPEIYYQVLLSPSEVYERYKVLYLQLFYLLDEREKTYLSGFNQHLGEKANDKKPGKVQRAILDWRKELATKKPTKAEQAHTLAELKVLEKSRRNLIIQCYLYHVILEKVHYQYLGLVDDQILKKLFAQGLVIYGLVDIYFRTNPKVMDYLNYIGIPLGVSHDNSLFLLNEGKQHSHTNPIRSWTLNLNLYRLGILRIRRLMISLNDAFELNDLSWWMQTFDPYIRSVMSVINFFYFFPRLLSHIVMIIKHVLIEKFLSEEAKQLTIWMRFKIQMVRRWEILLRDALWLANGILNFCVLLGAWGVWSLPINAFFQFVEVLLNLYLMYEFWAEYRNSLKALAQDDLFKGVSMDGAQSEFSKDLHKRFLSEEKNRYQRLVNSALILLSNLFVCAAFVSISIYFPLAGAIIGVLMTFVQFYTRFAWESERSEIKDPFTLPKVYTKTSTSEVTPKESFIPPPNIKVPVSNLGLTYA